MPDCDRGFRCDSVQEGRLVLSELTPRVQVQLPRSHQLARALRGYDEHMLRMATALDPGSGPLVQLDHERAHGGDGGADRLVIELPGSSAGAGGQVAVSYTHL